MTEHISLSVAVSAFLEQRKAQRLEKLDKEHEKLRKQGITAEAEAQLQRERDEEILRFHPATWLSDAAMRARQISFATHPLKFSHPDARGSSGNVITDNDQPEPTLLCTSALKQIKLDVVGNAAALDVAGLLQLEAKGSSLASQIASGDVSALAPFATDANQLEQWREGYAQALSDHEIRSHSMAKQVYFPVDEGYHLLSPLFSSAMAQAVHERISHSRYSEAAAAARKARREQQLSDLPCVDYPNLAALSFGGTKPQNISLLNSGRGGLSLLFNAEPPKWHAQFSLPKTGRQAFWQAYERRVSSIVWELGSFLLSVQHKDSTMEIRQQRADLVEQLMDELLDYAVLVQTQSQHQGWSSTSNLSRAEQLWLDPGRPEPEFHAERAAMDWCKEIAGQFALWLNLKLKHRKLPMSDTEYLEWQSELESRLRLLEKDMPFATIPDEVSP